MTEIFLTNPLLWLPSLSQHHRCPHQAMAGYRHHTLSLFLFPKT